MYKIGELSQLCRLSVKTLRFWTDIGLLVPDEIDRFTGYRYYKADRISDCHRILALKELGFTLEEIKHHLHTGNTAGIPALLEARRSELIQSAAKLSQQLRRLDSMLKNITEGESNMFHLVVRNESGFCAACVRKYFDKKEDAYALLSEMRQCLPKSVQGKRSAILNFETEYRERGFDLEVCVELCGPQTQYAQRMLSWEGDIASLFCRSETLGDAYHEINVLLSEMPAQVTGPFCEIWYDESNVELTVPVCLLHAPEEVQEKMPEVFENDPDVIGLWEFCDLVPSAEHFLPDHIKYSDASNVWLKKLCFLPKGGGYWVIKGWTKGLLFTSFGSQKHTYTNSYFIEERNGERFLLLSLKDRWHTVRGGKPMVYVYRQLDNLPHTPKELRIHDNVNLPFVPDPTVLGKWIACDFVKDPDDFSTEHTNPENLTLFWEMVEFFPDGTASSIYAGSGGYAEKWTNGTLLDIHQEVAQAYEIRRIDEKEYLFIQWKSGDYLYAGRFQWYVFKRA